MRPCVQLEFILDNAELAEIRLSCAERLQCSARTGVVAAWAEELARNGLLRVSAKSCRDDPGRSSLLTRIIHESTYCDRQLHAISGRARSSLVNVLFKYASSLIAVRASIWRTLGGLATVLHE